MPAPTITNSPLIGDSRMAKLINGKEMALKIQSELKTQIAKWRETGKRMPYLTAILVGDDPASVTYVGKKMEAAADIGICSATVNLPVSVTEKELIWEIERLNKDPSVDGILVQLPLPVSISERNVCNAVATNKDVDGFHIENIGRVCVNMDAFVPCTVMAVLEIIKRTKIDTFGKNIVVCGRSKNIGLPLALILHSDKNNELPGMEATVTMCHRNTPAKQLEMFTKSADIVISATGVIGLIKAHMIKPGACVIDVGTNRITAGDGTIKLVGDVDFDEVSQIAGHITPVPGGVGPMTVAMLMKNTFTAAKMALGE